MAFDFFFCPLRRLSNYNLRNTKRFCCHGLDTVQIAEAYRPQNAIFPKQKKSGTSVFNDLRFSIISHLHSTVFVSPENIEIIPHIFVLITRLRVESVDITCIYLCTDAPTYHTNTTINLSFSILIKQRELFVLLCEAHTSTALTSLNK